MENGTQSSLTNLGSIAGNTSPDNNRSRTLHENLSMKVFLHSRESRLPNILPSRILLAGRNTILFCVVTMETFHSCVHVKEFAVTGPDFAHPEYYKSSSYASLLLLEKSVYHAATVLR